MAASAYQIHESFDGIATLFSTISRNAPTAKRQALLLRFDVSDKLLSSLLSFRSFSSADARAGARESWPKGRMRICIPTTPFNVTVHVSAVLVEFL